MKNIAHYIGEWNWMKGTAYYVDDKIGNQTLCNKHFFWGIIEETELDIILTIKTNDFMQGGDNPQLI